MSFPLRLRKSLRLIATYRSRRASVRQIVFAGSHLTTHALCQDTGCSTCPNRQRQAEAMARLSPEPTPADAATISVLCHARYSRPIAFCLASVKLGFSRQPECAHFLTWTGQSWLSVRYRGYLLAPTGLRGCLPRTDISSLRGAGTVLYPACSAFGHVTAGTVSLGQAPTTLRETHPASRS